MQRRLLALFALSAIVACKQSASGQRATASAVASGLVDPKSPATKSVSLDLDHQEQLRVDGQPAGITRVATDLGRLQNIDELFAKIKPMASRDIVFHFTCAADVRGTAYMSALLTVGAAGFTSADVDALGGPVRVVLETQELAKATGNGAPLSDGPYGVLKMSDDPRIVWHSGDQTSETPIPSDPVATPYHRGLLAAWKAHPEAALLLIAAEQREPFDDFAKLLAAADAARAKAHDGARIMIGVVPTTSGH